MIFKERTLAKAIYLLVGKVIEADNLALKQFFLDERALSKNPGKIIFGVGRYRNHNVPDMLRLAHFPRRLRLT